jgi:uncharacterized protein (DUF2062 family)
MIHATKAQFRKWLEALLHIHDSPHRTACAFALGVLIGFSPLLGLHTVIGLGLAFLLRLNRVAVLVGVYANVPWVIAQYYALVTAIGAWALGTEMPPGFYGSLRALTALSVFSGEFWQRLASLLSPLLWPYVVGSTAGAAILAAVSYPVARTFVETGRRYVAHYHQSHGSRDEAGGHQRDD